MREINLCISDREVEVIPAALVGEPARIHIGPADGGVTLVGELSLIHQLIIEADRQISHILLGRSLS